MKRLCTVGCLLLLFAGCRSAPPDAVHISAAMSTRDVVESIAQDFTQQTGISVIVTPAASSTLARQIENGVDADLFLSADEQWADYLDKRGLVAQRRDLLGNRLVVIVPADSGATFENLSDLKDKRFERIALGREEVPAGAYARQALKEAGVCDAVSKRVVEGGDVRAVLTYVEHGEVDAGFVYATDAKASSKVRVVFEVPAKLHEPIRYPLVRLKRAHKKPSTGRFYEFLSGEAARKRFEDAGFTVLTEK
jgi:molybdate transport system substrate-binding protein